MTDLYHLLTSGVPDLPAAVFFLLIFFGTFISEDAACLAAGAAAASGQTSFGIALSASLLGIFAGDLLLYIAGRMIGYKVFESRIVRRFVTRRTSDRAAAWLTGNVGSAVFLSRFVTGIRLPTYLAAGAFKIDFIRFAVYCFIASAVWTPIIVGTAAFSHFVLSPQNAILGLIAAFLVLRLLTKCLTWRGRRVLIGRVKRIVRWEFWPLYVLYLPVVLYIFYLAVRYRSITVFTAVNPAIPAGGFKGESKNDIYAGLTRSRANADFLPAHVFIPAGDNTDAKLRLAERSIDCLAKPYPVVLKPNAGERGRGVEIVRSREELAAAIGRIKREMIIQEYVSGVEASIFYYRYPKAERGHIFSITEKQFPAVTGDGQKTLEELILADPRAVCVADKYFEDPRHSRDDVPVADESVQLIDIGTHSRGAIFVDGGWMWTQVLEDRIDEICRGYKGFYFGRFDVRAETFADLLAGKRFKIIELNGVTSESTNIYDPRYSLLDAYRILYSQWRIAFEIGRENIDLGAEPTRLSHLVKLALGMEASTIGQIDAGPVLTTEH